MNLAAGDRRVAFVRMGVENIRQPACGLPPPMVPVAMSNESDSLEFVLDRRVACVVVTGRTIMHRAAREAGMDLCVVCWRTTRPCRSSCR